MRRLISQLEMHDKAYVLPVLCVKLRFYIADTVAACRYCTAASLQRRALANAPAAFYLSHILNSAGRQDSTSVRAKVLGRSLQWTIAF